MFAWLVDVKLTKTVYETVIVKPAETEHRWQHVMMPQGIEVEYVWITQYGTYEGFAFIRIKSKYSCLKPIMLEVKTHLESRLKCKVGIGINNTLWISPRQRCYSELRKSLSGNEVIFKEIIHHPAECKIAKRFIEL